MAQGSKRAYPPGPLGLDPCQGLYGPGIKEIRRAVDIRFRLLMDRGTALDVFYQRLDLEPIPVSDLTDPEVDLFRPELPLPVQIVVIDLLYRCRPLKSAADLLILLLRQEDFDLPLHAAANRIVHRFRLPVLVLTDMSIPRFVPKEKPRQQPFPL
jgi:hypothetical protein